MIDAILPAGVSASEEFADPPGVVLFPEELAVIARAVDKRRREFTTARHCARRALSALGLPPAPIGTGERGAPRWPPGIVGSITHCAGYRAAAAARAGRYLTIGLDAEPDEPLPAGVLAAIASDSERCGLGRLAELAPGPCWDRLLFSAKETVYKAWFPVTGRRLDFDDADITINAAAGTFEARLLVAPPLAGGVPLASFSGRWLARDGLLLTAIAMPVPQSRG